MDKKRKVITLTIILTVIITIMLSSVSIYLIIRNNNLKENDIDIVVYQRQEDGKELEIYRENFTNDLKVRKVINSKINSNASNELIIEKGMCRLINTTCPTHSCEGYLIKNTSSILDSAITISCLPNGLYITIEPTVE